MGHKIDQSYFKDNSNENSNEIKDILANDEQILWESHPNKKAYVLSRILTMLPIAIIWLLFDGVFIGVLLATGAIEQMGIFSLVLVVFFILHLAPVWIWIGNIITGLAGHKNVHYVMTNCRLLIREGIIPNIKIIDYSSITSVNCKVGIVDSILKVGDIYITFMGSASGKAVLFDIANPYNTASSLQKIISDIKTDIQYPNDMRPETNSGYNTSYTPKQ